MKLQLVFLSFSVLLFNCSSNDTAIKPLLESGIIGDWNVSSKGINTIVSIESFCCETLSFYDDSNSYDLIGNYTFHLDEETIGNFTINRESNTIAFTTENGNSYLREYILDENLLEVSYYEDGNRYWTIYTRLL